MRAAYFYVGVFGCLVSVVVLLVRLLALRSQPMSPDRREVAELREVAACASLGMLSGTLMVPQLWFLLMPFAAAMAVRAFRLHRAVTETEGSP
jgi:hypothetical protein